MQALRPAILGGDPVRTAGPPDWPRPMPAVIAAIEGALADGTWGKYHGPHVAALTELLATTHCVEFAFPCASGTAAVELALRGLQIGPDDEVILAAYDFKGNFQDVLAVGASPVLIDVHPDNASLDPANFPAAISPRTKAIIVSHLHGGVVPMDAVRHIADAHGIAVIEDVAQMPGAMICGRIAGTWGDVGILSFGGSKLVTAGRGGAVITSRVDIAQRIKLCTQRGNEAYPLSELQAAAIVPQWRALPSDNERRSQNVTLLCDGLRRFAGLIPFRNTASHCQPGYYKLGFWYHAHSLSGLSREGFATAMRAEGIAIDAGFRALHKTHSARRFRAVGELPHATRADDSVLTLHHPVLLGDARDIEQIVAAVEKVHTHAAEITDKSS